MLVEGQRCAKRNRAVLPPRSMFFLSRFSAPITECRDAYPPPCSNRRDRAPARTTGSTNFVLVHGGRLNGLSLERGAEALQFQCVAIKRERDRLMIALRQAIPAAYRSRSREPALARTSGENLLVVAPPSQELEPPTNPARFTTGQDGHPYARCPNAEILRIVTARNVGDEYASPSCTPEKSGAFGRLTSLVTATPNPLCNWPLRADRASE